MINSNLVEKCSSHLNKLCNEIGERPVGSEGNRLATSFFEQEVSSLGWETESDQFNAVDWEENGASLIAGGKKFEVNASPYSLGCELRAELTSASTVEELEKLDASGKVILLHGEIAKEQLMPKNFVFYNPDEHKKIISLLEKSGAKAIISATGRNSSLAGGLYPFPLIEDGDFDIPSVYMTDIEGERLLKFSGQRVSLCSSGRRIPGKGYNITARKGTDASSRIVITAHIDAKKGTPGAIDNATGVTVLLLLAELLKDYNGEKQVELIAFNGEDYYAVPGQMLYINQNYGKFDKIILNINIDGAGYKEGESAYSFYNLPEEIKVKAESAFNSFPGVIQGPQWPQGDHSIFVQSGVSAIAMTSKWFTDNMDRQDVTHTKKDNLSIVDKEKVAMIAEAIKELIIKL